MKKKLFIGAIILLVIVGIVFAVLFCGQDNDKPDDDNKAPDTSAITTTTTPPNSKTTTTVGTTTIPTETETITTTTPTNTEAITTTVSATTATKAGTTTTVTTTKKQNTTTKPVVTTTKKPTTTTKKTTITTTTKKKTTTTTTTKKKTTTTTKKPAANLNVVTKVFDVDFSQGHSSADFHTANGWSNGSVFDCIWITDNVRFEENVMKLVIDKSTNSKYNYSGAEYRTNEFYHYGLYEVEMKPIKNIGVVSSFFTYTGPSENNPWDEIDIEFLGKDTTKVQFNYYTNGRGNHEKLYNLGFDASEDFHKYGFLWEEDKITWYVDGVAVHTATTNIPSTPGRIMMNVWPGINVDSWLGRYDGTTPLTAEYKSMKFTPIDKL